jgi:acyl carrier protein
VTEEALASIWGEVLKIGRVGIHDTFFESGGGHSLAALALVDACNRRFGVELPVRALFGGLVAYDMARLRHRT